MKTMLTLRMASSIHLGPIVPAIAPLRLGLENPEFQAVLALLTGHGNVQPAALRVEQARAGQFPGINPLDYRSGRPLFAEGPLGIRRRRKHTGARVWHRKTD